MVHAYNPSILKAGGLRLAAQPGPPITTKWYPASKKKKKKKGNETQNIWWPRSLVSECVYLKESQEQPQKVKVHWDCYRDGKGNTCPEWLRTPLSTDLLLLSLQKPSTLPKPPRWSSEVEPLYLFKVASPWVNLISSYWLLAQMLAFESQSRDLTSNNTFRMDFWLSRHESPKFKVRDGRVVEEPSRITQEMSLM
jgi:hypothetical protein